MWQLFGVHHDNIPILMPYLKVMNNDELPRARESGGGGGAAKK
jgi:hypothetical protein